MKINKLLGTKYPIIQGGMANIATHQLAAAVSNAGGLGLIGTGAWDVEKVRDEIRKTRELTDKPFGVNLMMMNHHIDALSDLMVEEGVKVVTTGAGNPGIYMEKWKAAGITVIPVVPTVALARRLERVGADAIIVEGTEAGGHVGEATTMALVPQVVDAVKIPVIAAGGIADGRGIVAAYALGAVGVQVGTAFLAAVECPIHENYKNEVVNAGDNDTVVTGRGTGAPVRMIKNRMAKEHQRLTSEGADKEELEKLTLGSLRKAVFEGDVEWGSVMAGQIVGLVKEIQPAKVIIENMFAHAEKVLAGLKEVK